MNSMTRPYPEITPLTAPYWEGLRAYRLRLQRCAACGKVRHYPRPLCDICYSFAVDWIDAAGIGTVHSWTVAYHAFHPSFKADIPYTLVTVDLLEGVRMQAPLRGDASGLKIGARVTLRFENVAADLTLPAFELEE